jgi:hypothetical protein
MTTGSLHPRRYAGTPREIGGAVGREMGPRLEENIARYIRDRPARPGALDLVGLRRGALAWLRGLPARFQEEMEGLAEGANLPLQRIAEWNYIERCVDDSCSGFVGRLDGRVWLARNNDMFVPGIWGHATVKEIAGRIPVLCFGQEGDTFTATGINRERLWLHHQALTVSDQPRPCQPHMSGWALMTDMLETCSAIDEVETRLGEVDRDEGMILFAVDGKTDEFAVLECACSRHTRLVHDEAWLVGTNHACALDEPSPAGSSKSRHARMEILAADLFGRLPTVTLPRDLIAMLADASVERRDERFSTVYANVACPRTGEVWFTLGACPAASRGEWLPIDWPW